MTVPILTHDEAETLGIVLAARIAGFPPRGELGWADVVQFVLRQAAIMVEERAAQAEARVRDSEVSREPVTRTIADIQAEIGAWELTR